MCTILLPPGDNPFSVNKYIIYVRTLSKDMLTLALEVGTTGPTETSSNVNQATQRHKRSSGWTCRQPAVSQTRAQQSSRTLLLTIYGYTVRDLEDKRNGIRNGSYFCTNICRVYDKQLIYGAVIYRLLQLLRDNSDYPQKSLSESPQTSLQNSQQ
jgi:hypothetical protein